MKKSCLLVTFLLLISFASAVTVNETTINNVIITDLNHPAQFTIFMFGLDPGTYNIYTLADVHLTPTSAFTASGEKQIDISINPFKTLDQKGFYTFTYILNNQERERVAEGRLTVKLVDLKEAIRIDSNSNNPDSGKVTFYVQNKENTKIIGLKAKFSSVFFDEVEKIFDLDKYEKKSFELSVDKLKLKTIAAGSYIINSVFETKDGTTNIAGKISLGEKKDISTEEDHGGFIIYTDTVKKINSGNVPETISISVEKDLFSRLFTSFNIEPNKVERQGFTVLYTWEKNLGPAQVIEVKTTTNYLFPLLILIAVVLVIIGIKRYLQTKIEVIKSVSHVRTKGGQFALRVRLNVKAKKQVKNVSLIDRIPLMVKVYEKFGTIKPSKMDVKNRRIHWNLDEMQPGEERVVNYIIYSKVGIVGKFSLPEATLVFEKNNQIHEVESNKVFFLSEQVSGE